MNNIEKDEMIIQLAEYVGVDLFNLEIINKEEEEKISLAHKLEGVDYDVIAHFFSQIKIPEYSEYSDYIEPEYIFKALKYNDSFFQNNITLIRATQWMREEIYEKAKKTSKSQKSKENQIANNIIQLSKKELRQNHKKQKEKKAKESIPNKYIVRIAATGDSFRLPECYKMDENADYEKPTGDCFPSPGNLGYKEFCIKIKPNDMEQFISRNPLFYVKLYPSEEDFYEIGPVAPVRKNKTIAEINVPVREDIILGSAWGLSEKEGI